MTKKEHLDDLIKMTTKYDEDKCIKTALSLYEVGASHSEVAAKLGVTYDCFEKWRHKHKKFGEAIECGKQLSQAWWLEQARVNVGNKDFNVKFWIQGFQYRKLSVKNLKGTIKERLKVIDDSYNGERISLADFERLNAILQKRLELVDAIEINKKLTDLQNIVLKKNHK